MLRYILKDTELDSLDTVAEYSVNNGMNWHAASTEGKLTSIVDQNYTGSVVWRTDGDINLETVRPPDQSAGLLFKLTPIDKQPRPRNCVPAVWNFGVDTTSIGIADVNVEEEGDVLLRFFYPNPARAALDSFAYHYSIDLGSNGNAASVRLGAGIADESQDSMYVVWSTDIDIPNQGIDEVLFRISANKGIDEVLFRISANKGNTYENYCISRPFHIDNNVIPTVSFSDFNEDQFGIFHIGYTISDMEYDPVSLGVQYSIYQGRTWRQSAISNDLSNITSAGYTGTVKWYSEFDITEFTDIPIRLRLRPSDRDPGLFVDRILQN